MRKSWLLGIALLIGLTACDSTPVDVDYFDPDIQGTAQSVNTYEQEVFVSDTSRSFQASITLFAYKTMVAAPLTIKNLTAERIEPDDYSVTLTDGRDRKPVKLLTRDDLIKIKAKYSSGSSTAIQDQVIEATMTNVMNAVNVPTKDKIIATIQRGIDQYFAFRPLYPNEIRTGILCFFPDFALEYPLILTIKVKDETLVFRFRARSTNK